MRAFVALPLSDDCLDAVERCVRDLKFDLRSPKWEAREKWHLTAKFLGDVTDLQMSTIVQSLSREIGERAWSIRFNIAGIGTFPERGAPRVIWIGAEPLTSDVGRLAGTIDALAADAGVPREERAFVSHLTIARCKYPMPAKERSHLESARFTFGEVEIRELLIIESLLSSEGSHYRVLDRMVLFPVTQGTKGTEGTP